MKYLMSLKQWKTNDIWNRLHPHQMFIGTLARTCGEILYYSQNENGCNHPFSIIEQSKFQIGYGSTHRLPGGVKYNNLMSLYKRTHLEQYLEV